MGKKRVAVIILLFMASLFLPLLALFSGAGNFEKMNPSDVKDIAKVTSAITFSLSGILIFVLGQALSNRQQHKKSDYGNPALVNAFTVIAWMSILLIASGAGASLFSIMFLLTNMSIWMTVSFYIFLFIIGSLIFTALLYGILALTRCFS